MQPVLAGVFPTAWEVLKSAPAEGCGVSRVSLNTYGCC